MKAKLLQKLSLLVRSRWLSIKDGLTKYFQKLQKLEKSQSSSGTSALSTSSGELSKMRLGTSDILNSFDITFNSLIRKGLAYNYLDEYDEQLYAITGKGIKLYRNKFRGVRLNQDEKSALTVLYRLAVNDNKENKNG